MKAITLDRSIGKSSLLFRRKNSLLNSNSRPKVKRTFSFTNMDLIMGHDNEENMLNNRNSDTTFEMKMKKEGM